MTLTDKQKEKLESLFHELYEYFDDRADADYDGGFIPNKEMQMLSQLETMAENIGLDYKVNTEGLKKFSVENQECTLEEIKEVNSFGDDDELYQMIASLEIGETTGEGLNMAIITRLA